MMSDKDDNLVKNQIFGDNSQAVNEKEPDNDVQAPADTGEPEETVELDPKFESIKEQAKGYKEAQAWGTQRAQEASAAKAEVKRLQTELEQLRQAVAPDMAAKQQERWRQYAQQSINAAVVDENPEPLVQLINQLVDSRTEQKLQERDMALEPIRKQQRFQTDVNNFLANNPEASEYIDDMTKLIQTEPDIVEKPDWLYKAYGKVLNQKLKGSAAAKAKTEAAKEAAGMPGSGPRGSQETLTEDEMIKKQIFGSQKKKMFDY